MNIKSMIVGELGANCYIVYENSEALIFDPGGNPEKIMAFLDEHQLVPQAILLTHAHFDHIGGVDELRNHYQIEVYLHEAEAHWLSEPSLNRSTAFMRTEVKTDPPEQILTPGTWTIGSFTFDIIHTPGHSPGSVSFIFAEDEFIISGDVLFKQGVGRTDLPGGSFEQLVNSIQQHLYTLPDTYTVYPGHGLPTTIGAEKKTNPFVPAT